MSKHKYAVLIILLSSFCLSGCVSNSKYEALERRVSILEERLGVTNSETVPNHEIQADTNGDKAVSYDINKRTNVKDQEIAELNRQCLYNLVSINLYKSYNEKDGSCEKVYNVSFNKYGCRILAMINQVIFHLRLLII